MNNVIFTNLPLEITPKFFNNIGPEELKKCEFVCKDWHNVINSIENYSESKENYFANKKILHFNYLPKKVVKDFGGVKSLCQLPVNKTNSFWGFPGFLNPKNMSFSIMRGVKNLISRTDKVLPFIAFKIDISGNCSWQDESYNDNSSSSKALAIVFDKTTSSVEVHGNYRGISIGLFSEKKLEAIVTLIKTGKLITQENFWFGRLGNESEMTFSLCRDSSKDNCIIS